MTRPLRMCMGRARLSCRAAHVLYLPTDGQPAYGATAIEYGHIAALIAVAAVTVMGTVGTNLSSTFNTVANSL
jgi:pilus assembly protein Flp/PilA